jgi:uroporphyrinogen decarboxylase
MNSRERMLAAINRLPIDRIPTDIWATPEVWEKLCSRFGDEATTMAELHIDGMGSVSAEYSGPALPKVPEDETINYWGMRTKQMAHEGGFYDEQFFYPLADAKTIDDLAAYPWPQAEWFSYSLMKARAKMLRETQVVLCGYMAPFFFHNLLRGLEQSLIDPLEDPEFTHALLRRISDFFYEYHRRMFDACDGLVDVAQVTDDLGTQKGPMISLDLYKEFYAPHHKRFIDLCHEFGIKVLHHDDGSNRIFLPTLVEIGIDILNPVQWTCPGMDMANLKRDFGQQICFHGAVENQRILPFGTIEEVRAEVRHCIDELASDGTGYILAPCHNLQVNTPVENIIAMYDEAYHYGKMSQGI